MTRFDRQGLFAAALLLLAGCGHVVGPGTPDGPVTPSAPTAEERAAIERFAARMNDHRARIGCPRLVWHDAVGAAAQRHSEEMHRHRYLSHTNRNGEGPGERLGAAGINSMRAWAENIADVPGADRVLQVWLDSPGHRANMERCDFTHHGVGLRERKWTHKLVRLP